MRSWQKRATPDSVINRRPILRPWCGLLFLFPHTFERLVIGFLVNELSGFRVTLHPALDLWIEDL